MNFFSCFGMLISIVWHFVQSDVNSRIGLRCSVFYQPIVLKMASFGSPLKLDSKSVSETSVLVMTSLSEHLEKFRKFGYTTSPTFKYWDLFLKATEILILNIRSERQGSWNMQLSSIASMLPYLTRLYIGYAWFAPGCEISFWIWTICNTPRARKI